MSAPASAAVARRRRLAVVVAALLVIGTAAWMVTRSPFLDVDRVVVLGNATVTTDEVLLSSGVAAGDAMVWLDPGASARAIEALPWVRSAQVQREWPATVRITVRERVPVAWVDVGGGRAMVVDRTGFAITEDAPPAGLPQIVAVTPSPVGARITPTGGAWLAGRLSPEQRGGVRSIAVADRRATLVVASGQEVRFGRLNQVSDKMRAAFAVLVQPGVDTAAYVDVSAPSTPVAG